MRKKIERIFFLKTCIVHVGNVPMNGEVHEGNGDGRGRKRFNRPRRVRTSQSDKTGGEKVNNFDN
jgi:hypothetical protein